jgi:hypothetical protein
MSNPLAPGHGDASKTFRQRANAIRVMNTASFLDLFESSAD